jgi:hypothetical protein
VDVPPDVAWLGPLAGCGGWLGIEMEPPWFCVVELLLAALPLAELPLVGLGPGELLLPVLLLGEVVASAA